jgi:hypothetical protein
MRGAQRPDVRAAAGRLVQALDAAAEPRRTNRTTKALRWLWAIRTGFAVSMGVMSFKAEAGHHLVPKELSSGRNVFDKLGDWFTLLTLDATEIDVAALASGARGERVPGR